MTEEEIKKEKLRQKSRKYYQEHKKDILEKQKIYKRNRYQNMTPEEKKIFFEKRKPIMKKYRNKNKEKFIEHNRKAKLKRMESGKAPKTKNMLIKELQDTIDKARECTKDLVNRLTYVENFDIEPIDFEPLLSILGDKE